MVVDRSDIVARIEYFGQQEHRIWRQVDGLLDEVEVCRTNRIELLAELAMMEVYLGLDEDPGGMV